MNEKNFNWIPIVELAILAFTCLGTTITLHIHSDSNMKKSEERTAQILEAMRKDILVFHRETSELMRDFHGRLCAIEERNKK